VTGSNDDGIDDNRSFMVTGDHYYGEAAPSKGAVMAALGREDVLTAEHRAHTKLQPEVGPSSAQRPSLAPRVDDARCASFPFYTCKPFSAKQLLDTL
jgi:hypothetical protein